LWKNGLPKDVAKWATKRYLHDEEVESLRRERSHTKDAFQALMGEKYLFLEKCILFEMRFVRHFPETGKRIAHLNGTTSVHLDHAHANVHIEPWGLGFHPEHHGVNLFGTVCMHPGHWMRTEWKSVEKRIKELKEQRRLKLLGFDFVAP
jgi:hypothetical protein